MKDYVEYIPEDEKKIDYDYELIVHAHINYFRYQYGESLEMVALSHLFIIDTSPGQYSRNSYCS